MPYFEFLWVDENVAHIAEHDVTTGEFEYVVRHPERRDVSHSPHGLVPDHLARLEQAREQIAAELPDLVAREPAGHSPAVTGSHPVFST